MNGKHSKTPFYNITSSHINTNMKGNSATKTLLRKKLREQTLIHVITSTFHRETMTSSCPEEKALKSKTSNQYNITISLLRKKENLRLTHHITSEEKASKSKTSITHSFIISLVREKLQRAKPLISHHTWGKSYNEQNLLNILFTLHHRHLREKAHWAKPLIYRGNLPWRQKPLTSPPRQVQTKLYHTSEHHHVYQ